MKSKFKIIATALLLGSMVACGGGNTPSTQPSNNPSSETPVSSESFSSETQESEDPIISSEIPSVSEGPTVEYETVNYEVNISDLPTGTAAEDIVTNKFTIPAGTEIRNRTKTFNGVEYKKSVKLGSSSAAVLISSPGAGTLKFLVQNGSSGADYQTVVLTKPDGTTEDIQYVGNAEGSPVVEIEVEVVEGSYKIQRKSGTSDIFYLSLSCTVEKAEETGFEIVSKGKVDFIEGQSFDASGLVLNTVFGNGRTDSLDVNDSNVTIDSSAFNSAVPGTYPIVVKYKEYAPISYDVKVHEAKELELGFDAIEKISNSSAGNGVYFNHSSREVYRVGEEFDARGLNVHLLTDEMSFAVTSDIQVSGFDSSTAGAKDVTVSYTTNGKTITKVFTVHVVDTAPSKVGDVFQVRVDQSYTGVIGAVENGYNCFKTVQQALDYLGNSTEITSADQKYMFIADGTYTEKLEITIPFLKIAGESAENTIIEWDSLYGVEDAGGFTHTTDSTATVAVRETAIQCTMENVTISNFYNSQARFDERGYGIERALALLVQSDKFIMKDSKLLGVQDTLELFTGRQLFENTYISGYTDFIFGTNNTTYFNGCTIHTVDTSKDDSGTAGYITAFKGSNKGAGDSVTYGAIFDGCNFTADEGVMKGKTAIGRPWGAYAAVAVINSELGDHISTVGYSTSKNERYVAMSGVKPTDSTVKFVEYNNTGAGAISEAVAGCRMLSDEEAANYSNYEVIFGTTNDNVSYSDAWDPTSTEIVVDDATYYHFDGKSSPTGTTYLYTDNIQGTTGTFEDIEIDATKGKVTARTSDTQINAGAKMTFNVEAGTMVTVTTYPGYHPYTLNGVEAGADTFSQYYAEATTVVFEAVGTVYLYSIVVNLNEEAPVATTATGISISGQTTTFTEGDAFTYEGLVVKASYSDNSIKTLDASEYTVTLDREIDGAGKYTATVAYGEFTATYEVEFVASGVDASVITEDTTIEFISNGNYSTSKVDISGATVRENGDNCQVTGTVSIKVQAGATVEVIAYGGQYTHYTVSINGGEPSSEQTGDYSVTVGEDSIITFTSTDNNNYFKAIKVTYGSDEVDNMITENTSITFGSEGNYRDNPKFDMGTCNYGDNGGTNSQIKEGSFSIEVKAGATVTVNGYPGYTSYSVSINGGEASEEITDTTYTFTVEEDSTIVFTPVNGGKNYLYGIDVTF